MRRRPTEYHAGDLFGELYQPEVKPAHKRLSDYLPGLAACGTVALAAAWLSEHYGFPIILLGLLIGMALSFLADVERTAPGLDFSSRTVLQCGIVLLGLQVTFAEIASLGWLAFVGLLIVMAVSFAAALLAAKAVGEQYETGLLAGGATAICGASAALAIYGVMGDKRIDQARFSVTLVGIALASAIAMSAYPAIAQMAGFDDGQAGFLIGAAVHDAGQAIGGAYSYSDSAGVNATVVKLSRVAMLAPLVAIVAWWFARKEQPGSGKKVGFALPWFIPAFFVLVVANSFVTLPPEARDAALTVSKACLLLAVTATAMRSRLELLLEAGWRTLVPVFAATLVSFLAAFAITLGLS